MKHTFTFFSIAVLLLITASASAQKDAKPNHSSYFEKGNRVVGIELGVAGEYPINSVTKLNISKTEKNYGLLLLPSYGRFVENNWVVGGQAILGFANDSYTYQSGSSSGVVYTSSNKSRYTDFGIAPFTRYFVPLGKRNVVSLFGHASLPVIYSTSKEEYKQSGGFPNTYSSNDYEVRVIASLGLGVSLNGRFGSLEVNANNTGLYVGLHKYFQKK
jgi:hypothetical protein